MGIGMLRRHHGEPEAPEQSGEQEPIEPDATEEDSAEPEAEAKPKGRKGRKK